MKQLSYWAKLHPQSARLIIILLYIPINLIGLVLGSLLWDVGIQLTTAFLQLIVFLVLALFLIYPKKATFLKRKIFHGCMALCTFLMICFYGNQINQPNPHIFVFNSTQAVSYTTINEQPVKAGIGKSKKETHQLKKELRKQLRKSEDGKQLPTWAKVLLILLSSIAALFLLVLVLYLSCSLACNGAEALAIIVLLAGLFGIFFGANRLTQLILGKKRRKRMKSEVEGR
jgi:membrane protease YdiL (CAAX protease family)